MDAILANVFLSVQAQLAQEVPDLKFIDQDTGQLEYVNQQNGRPAVLFPCALIDLHSVSYEDAGERLQSASGMLRIRFGVDPFTQATNYFSQPQKETALNFYNIEHKINLALHGWSNGQYFSPLSRKRATTEGRQDHLRVRVLDYQVIFMDDTAMLVETTIPRPDLTIDTVDQAAAQLNQG